MHILLATHPRSGSTAFERSFMTRDDTECFHEPFSDAYYYGPDRLSQRYSVETIAQSPYKDSSYSVVIEGIESAPQSKHVFIKDMALHFMRGSSSPGKSFLPDAFIHKYKSVILVRPPHQAAPSYYTQCIPPRSSITGFDSFSDSELGYAELREWYELLESMGITPLVITSYDLGHVPETVIRKVCDHCEIEFDPKMMQWQANNPQALHKFDKWSGWHDDALGSGGFRINHQAPCRFIENYDQWRRDWGAKFDADGVKVVEQAVRKSMADYQFLYDRRCLVEHANGRTNYDD